MATTRPNTTADEATAGAAALEGLTVTVHHPRPAVVLIRVHGEVDLATAPQLREVLDQVCSEPAPGRSRQVVCDLSGIDFLAAGGVDALMNATETATGNGVELHLIANTRQVRRVLAVCGVDQQLLVTSELADILDAAGNRPDTR